MRLRVKRKQKYNSKSTEYRGRKYDSKAEAEYAMLLDVMQESGEVHLWLRQTAFDLGEDTRYRADFFVITSCGLFRAVDVKGFETPAFKKIKKLWRKYGVMPLHLVRKGITYEVVSHEEDKQC